MRFTWQEQHQLLRETLQRFVSERYDFEARGRRSDGFETEVWQELAALGVLGAPFDEIHGGIGGSALDILLVMEAFGRGLVTAPYIPNVLLAGGLLRRAADEPQKAELIPPLIAGERQYCFAYAEAQSRHNPLDVAVRAQRTGDGYLVNGRKAVVLGAPQAQACFLTARTGGGQREAGGVSLFLTSLAAPGVSMRAYRCMDGTQAADITFEDLFVPREGLFGPEGEAAPIVEQVLDEAAVATCAEAVGIIGALNERCLEFAKTRRAFGQAVAEFQVIQHRLVDMQIAYEMASAITLKAASQIAENAPQAARTAAACKVLVNDEAGFVGKAAVQLHGAIGMTDELDVGHYFKRLLAIRSSFGDADHHLRRRVRMAAAAQPSEAEVGH